MKRITILLIWAICSSCYTYSSNFTTEELAELETSTLTRQNKEANHIGKRFVNRRVEELMKAVPNIKVEEYVKDKFRYTIRYEVLTVPTEIYRDYNSVAYMNIYLFSDESGKITHYEIDRISF